MTLTAGQLVEAIRHRIGGPVDPKLGGAMRIGNLAGQWLDSVHAWQQRLRVSAVLNFTFGDTTLALPANVKTIVAAQQGASTGLGRRVHWLGPQDQLNASLTGLEWGGWDVLVAIQSTGTGWTLGLAQLPGVSTADFLTISYLAGWADLKDDKDKVVVHPFYEPLLLHVVREYAAGVELGDLELRLASILQGPLLYAAKVADGGATRNLGQQQGGAVAAGWGYVDWNGWIDSAHVGLP